MPLRSSVWLQQGEDAIFNRIAGNRRATWPSIWCPHVTVSILPLPTCDCPGLRHTFTVATRRRLEPPGRRQARHMPVRVIATSGASWLLACLVSHKATEVEICIVQIAQRVIVTRRREVESVICVSDRPKSGSVGRVGPRSIHSRCWVGPSENFDRKPSETV